MHQGNTVVRSIRGLQSHHWLVYERGGTEGPSATQSHLAAINNQLEIARRRQQKGGEWKECFSSRPRDQVSNGDSRSGAVDPLLLQKSADWAAHCPSLEKVRPSTE